MNIFESLREGTTVARMEAEAAVTRAEVNDRRFASSIILMAYLHSADVLGKMPDHLHVLDFSGQKSSIVLRRDADWKWGLDPMTKQQHENADALLSVHGVVRSILREWGKRSATMEETMEFLDGLQPSVERFAEFRNSAKGVPYGLSPEALRGFMADPVGVVAEFGWKVPKGIDGGVWAIELLDLTLLQFRAVRPALIEALHDWAKTPHLNSDSLRALLRIDESVVHGRNEQGNTSSYVVTERLVNAAARRDSREILVAMNALKELLEHGVRADSTADGAAAALLRETLTNPEVHDSLARFGLTALVRRLPPAAFSSPRL